jgi:ppGpp synthetase/RelA/SpoT-type nucleotidyltranferase
MREIAQIRGRLQKLIIADEESLNDDLDDGYELFFALEKFRRLNKEYEDKKDRSFTEEVLKKRSKYMDYLINKLSKKKNLQNEGSAQE